MIYLIDELPCQCPRCGRQLKWSPFGKDSFYKSDVQECECGTRFQYMSYSMIVKASTILSAGVRSYMELYKL